MSFCESKIINILLFRKYSAFLDFILFCCITNKGAKTFTLPSTVIPTRIHLKEDNR